MDTAVYNLYPIIIIITYICINIYYIRGETGIYRIFSVDCDCDVRNEFTYEEIIQILSDSQKNIMISLLFNIVDYSYVTRLLGFFSLIIRVKSAAPLPSDKLQLFLTRLRQNASYCPNMLLLLLLLLIFENFNS